MIKFKVQGAKQPMLAFGLSEENINRLKKGQPIMVDLKEMGIEADFMIFYGATEADMVKSITPMIGKDTIIKESKEK